MTINGRVLIREPWETDRSRAQAQPRFVGKKKIADLRDFCAACQTSRGRAGGWWLEWDIGRKETGDRRPAIGARLSQPAMPWHPFAMKYNLNQHSLITFTWDRVGVCDGVRDGVRDPGFGCSIGAVRMTFYLCIPNCKLLTCFTQVMAWAMSVRQRSFADARNGLPASLPHWTLDTWSRGGDIRAVGLGIGGGAASFCSMLTFNAG